MADSVEEADGINNVIEPVRRGRPMPTKSSQDLGVSAEPDLDSVRNDGEVVDDVASLSEDEGDKDQDEE